MSTAEATRQFSTVTQELGEKIVSLTLKEAKELSDYLEEVHGIKPAAGGAVMMAAPADGGGAAAAPSPAGAAIITAPPAAGLMPWTSSR